MSALSKPQITGASDAEVVARLKRYNTLVQIATDIFVAQRTGLGMFSSDASSQLCLGTHLAGGFFKQRLTTV